MGLLSGSSGKEKAPDPTEAEVEELDDEPKNMLLSLISQLRIGMDLHRVTLPVFVLEPRSMLERITDFLSHPDLIFGTGKEEDPEKRFVQVLRYYLAGWHIKPKGVKKPYNPVLGEIFRCSYKYPDGTTGYYIAEQVSHHPPISAFYYTSPENELEIWGELRPKSKFLGNSAASIMEGSSKVRLLDREEDKVYFISMPNMYARGILFGKMVMELGDTSSVKNDANQIECNLEFKTKGFFSGTYNAIAGTIKSKGNTYGEVSGKWNEVMEITKKKDSSKGVLFDATDATTTQKIVAPESEQEEFESRRLWSKVTDAIKKKDLDAATDQKTVIEDGQRERNKEREEKGLKWEPRFFEIKEGAEDYSPKFTLPEDKSKRPEAVKAWIWPSATAPAQETK